MHPSLRERREHMSTATTVDVVGTARDRVDGQLKVMGAATYPIDVTLPGMAHAALLQSGDERANPSHRGGRRGEAPLNGICSKMRTD